MISKPSHETYLHAKQLLLQGELVAFPTETVYGLWANALDTKAITKIFETKGRPQKNPIIVHVGSKEQISLYAEIRDPREQKIIDMLMPGPITILLPKKQHLPDLVTAGSPFVGIRIPSNTIAQTLLCMANIPLAAPSANISSKPSPTSAEMVRDNVQDTIPLIIDGGICEVGIESTVVKVESDHILITRPGFITQEDLHHLFGWKVEVRYSTGISEITPGNMFKHYSPSARVQIIKKIENSLFSQYGDVKNIALIGTKEMLKKEESLLKKYKNTLHILEWGTHENLVSCAKSLFELYHYCDKLGIDHIFIEGLPEEWIGYAIMNRVKRSAEK